MIKRLSLALVVLVVIVLGVGFLLPRQIHVERSRVIDAPQATLFTLVNSFGRYAEWSPWDEYNSDPQKTPEPELVTHLFLPVK